MASHGVQICKYYYPHTPSGRGPAKSHFYLVSFYVVTAAIAIENVKLSEIPPLITRFVYVATARERRDGGVTVARPLKPITTWPHHNIHTPTHMVDAGCLNISDDNAFFYLFRFFQLCCTYNMSTKILIQLKIFLQKHYETR